MTRSEQIGLVRFLRVHASGRITGRCVASDITSARQALRCGGEEYVTSAASHAIGMPLAVRAAFGVRLCRNCCKPLADPGDYCPVCVESQERRTAKRTADRDAARVGRNHQREAMREARAGSPRGRHQPRPL